MLDPATETQPIRAEQRPPFERIALLLQGGGVLGAYQAGAYEVLSEANLHPDWVAGISIGAVNAVHSKSYEGTSKDYEFSRRTMEEHWQSGYNDVVRSLQHPEVLQRPDNPEGFEPLIFARKD
jgi:predicted acylesterase/phospholipase RssA